MFNYKMTATGKAFHECDKPVKMLVGPYGSGKSCCCAVDVLAYACAQAAASDGIRYTKVGVIRSTYPELISTTRRSLLEVLPSECGEILSAGAPIRGSYDIPLQDGTRVKLEIEMFALKTIDDCEKIKSTNWSFAWINEATGIQKEILTKVISRCSRYPSKAMGGISWGGIILDFNMPERGSWLDEYLKNPEPNWGVFKQPPAALMIEEDGKRKYIVNDEAENLYNLGAYEEGDPPDFSEHERGKRYYRNQIALELKNGREDIVQNLYCMMDVPIIEGRPVYTNFSQERHISKIELTPVLYHTVIIGMDQSGFHPAAIMIQQQEGKWCVLDEIYAKDECFEVFIHQMLVPLLRSKYNTNKMVAIVDPSNRRDDWAGLTPKQRLMELGIATSANVTNSPKLRIQAVESMLNQEAGGLLISPTCEILIRGFISEYRYRKLRSLGTIAEAYTPQPEKNDASHMHDALQYAALYIRKGGNVPDEMKIATINRTLEERRRILSSVV